MDDTLVFIDGGFLSKLSKHFGSGKYLSYNLINFSVNLARKQNLNCERIFYYTAPPFQSNPPTNEENGRKERYDRFVKKISENNLIRIREGRCQRLKNEKDYFEYCQKGVDTLVTMDLVSVPIRYPQIKKIILLACDSDFVPVIRNMQEMNVKTILFTYYSAKRKDKFSTSNELIKSVYKYVLLTKQDFDDAILEAK